MMVADVPVKIAFMHGDETLGEYEDTINLTRTKKTAEGRQREKRLRILTTLDGQPLEGALYTMASEEVQARTDEFTQTHARTDLVKHASGHKPPYSSDEKWRYTLPDAGEKLGADPKERFLTDPSPPTLRPPASPRQWHLSGPFFLFLFLYKSPNVPLTH
jgi:hypothetical protein